MIRAWIIAVAALAFAGCAEQKQFSSNQNLHEAASVNLQLAIEYMKSGKLSIAQEKLERALRQDPDSPSVQATAGLLYERLRDTAQAEKHYASAAHLGRNDPNILNTYAGFLCRTGKAAEGEKMFVEVSRNGLYQTPEVALTNAGVCARSAQRKDIAEQYFRDALGRRANFGEALLQLANLTYEKGNDLSARAFVQRFLGNNPATPEILWLAVRIERRLHDDSSAAEYARQLQDQYPASDEARALRAGGASLTN
jgi:type IV pilus assembly protein PilF